MVEREILPNDERWQARGYVDPELWPSAGAAGLLGTDVPVEHGGLGGDFGFECVVYEELLHAGFACFGKGVHEIATHYVLEYGNDEQRAAWLPRARARRARGRDRDDRAGRRLGPARHRHLGRPRRRPLRRQRLEDVHHERPAREL